MKAFAFAFLAAALPGMACAQSATYEVQGFPMSLHQAQATGLANVTERVETPSPEYQGLPASPLQLLVLSDHTAPIANAIAAQPDDAIHGRHALLVRASQ